MLHRSYGAEAHEYMNEQLKESYFNILGVYTTILPVQHGQNVMFHSFMNSERQHKEFPSFSVFKRWKEEEGLTYTSFAQPKGESLCTGGYSIVLYYCMSALAWDILIKQYALILQYVRTYTATIRGLRDLGNCTVKTQ